MKFQLAAVLTATAFMADPTFAFLPSGPLSLSRQASKSISIPTSSILQVSPQDLTEYMAKAHEEKLRAVKMVEDQKKAEIESLRKEIAELKSAPPAPAKPTWFPASGSSVADMSKEQLAQKVLSYQQFVAKYIVDSQQQKNEAIQALEMKYRQQSQPPKPTAAVAAATTTTTTTTTPTVTNERFDRRNAMVAATAAAGKSRWGEMEIAKATGAAVPAPTVSVVNFGAQLVQNGNVAAPPAATKPSTSPVTAPSSATGINFGAQLFASVQGVAASTTSTSTASPSRFDARNAMVASAANAGKSRWGDMEIAKAKSMVGSTPSSAAPSAPRTTNSRFDARNAMVVATANAGKSRWGDMEIEKAKSMAGSTPSSAAAAPAASSTTNPRFAARNAMVVATANAGKSRWGDMEVEKAKNMASTNPAVSSSSSTAAPATSGSTNPRFNARNAMVVATANAGKSRWGDMEVEKAKTMAAASPVASSSSTAAPAASGSTNPRFNARNAMVVATANAGKSRWGDMEIEKAKSMAAASSSPAASTSNTRYDTRNAMVVSAANAGKSRWGDMEIQKAQSLMSTSPTTTKPATMGVPLHAAATRVNFGAALLGM